MKEYVRARNFDHLHPEVQKLAVKIATYEYKASQHVAHLKALLNDATRTRRRRAVLQQVKATGLVARTRKGLARIGNELWASSEEHNAQRAQKVLNKPLVQVNLNPPHAFFDTLAHESNDTLTITEDELGSILANVSRALNDYRQQSREHWYRIHSGADAILSNPRYTIKDLPFVLGQILAIIDPEEHRPFPAIAFLPLSIFGDSWLLEGLLDAAGILV